MIDLSGTTYELIIFIILIGATFAIIMDSLLRPYNNKIMDNLEKFEEDDRKRKSSNKWNDQTTERTQR